MKLAAYATGLIAIFGVSAGAGAVIGPDNTPQATNPTHVGAHGEPASNGSMAHGEPAPTGSTAHGEPSATSHDNGAHPGEQPDPAGLQSIQDGYRFVPLTTELPSNDFRFQILDPAGAPVTTYTRAHDKDLHLIVVRRDLSHYQHVHPTLSPDGTWHIPLKTNNPGQYRLFADFQTAGHELTLGVDVPAPGDYRPIELPHPEQTAEVAGYQVTMTGDFAEGDLTFKVTRDGEQITTEPYLGARGHLVALRQGDLAYLHVHPTDPESLAFHAEVPSAGVYRLYLDFQHDGKVHTAEFTADTGHTHK
ncbi:hypothetical protein B0I29_102116 [Actinoplanes lutulentus]|uniref:Secreted protein n=1 Tax=Actinoplanes lutulentus TaxID=1287878 RepID=A0A327ZJ42_9ACTN|nr:hypothetical protein B0I29_102116 [Actinoplanes lutulentus]